MKKILLLLTVALVCMTANAELSVFSPENNDYIKEWGRLKVDGTYIVSESGEQIQLKGWSSYGWQDDSGDCHSEEAIKQMKVWGANIYRGAMPVEDGGYNSDPDKFTRITKDLIDLTAKYGIYYLCTWYADGDPLDEKFNKYNDYFKEITQYVKSKEYKHVLYEICNEPNGVNWDRIKEYANKAIPTIRQNEPDAIIVVGTPNWNQRIDQAKSNPLTGYSNIMYSFHYSACSHQGLLGYYQSAVNVIPVFISEWSVANFDNSQVQGRNIDNNCTNGAKALMDEAFRNRTPWCCWAFGEKAEQASALMSCGSMELSPSGIYVVENYMISVPVCCTSMLTCHLGECQKVPGIIDLGKYNTNPDGIAETKDGLTIVGAGEGVTYHEENSVDEQNDKSLCNGAYKDGGEGFNFRPDECVDVSNCYGITNTEGYHNLSYIEPFEWETYTLEIEEPGFYAIEALVNPTTKQELSIVSESYGENLLYNIDTEEQLSSISFATDMKSEGDDWKHWQWQTPDNNLDDAEEIPAGLLFREYGMHTIRITWGAGTDNVKAAGDFGPILLTYAKAYNGPEYKPGKTKDVASNGVVVYPSPATDVVYATGDVAKISICNIAGCIVAEASANSVNIAALANGTYIAKVTLTNGAVVTKKIIKK